MTRLAVIACLFISSCALLQPPPPAEAPLRPGEILSAQAASNALTVGKSTKADVRALLGDATVIDFDSGYSVWVYKQRLKEKAKPPAPELVLLFAPSAVLSKMRLR